MRQYYSLFAFKFFLAGIVISSLALSPIHSQALSIDSARDCDDNAILRCGALTTDELWQKYQSSGMGPVYARFGITGTEISNAGTSALSGTVTREGQVIVGGKVVATGAITAGRQYMPGSTAATSGGINFYERPPRVSFASASLPAFVVLENGQFSYAIIASCGNPVKATPVLNTAVPAPVPKAVPRAPTPLPQPAPPAVTVPTSVTITNTNTQSQSQAQGGRGAETPAATATSQTSPADTTQPGAGKTPAALPNTGPGSIFALSGLSSIFATAGHMLVRRKKTI